MSSAWNSQGGNDPAWDAKAEKMRGDFKTATHGHEKEAGGQSSEKPAADHNLEPSIQDKQRGAAMDRASSHRPESHRAASHRNRSQDHGLG